MREKRTPKLKTTRRTRTWQRLGWRLALLAIFGLVLVIIVNAVTALTTDFPKWLAARSGLPIPLTATVLWSLVAYVLACAIVYPPRPTARGLRLLSFPSLLLISCIACGWRISLALWQGNIIALFGGAATFICATLVLIYVLLGNLSTGELKDFYWFIWDWLGDKLWPKRVEARTFERLDALKLAALDNGTPAAGGAKLVRFDDRSKLIILSDAHRGVGDLSDEFAHSENVFIAALSYYHAQGFTYIELGDGEELWENKFHADRIYQRHRHAYQAIERFCHQTLAAEQAVEEQEEQRVYLLVGNHDHFRGNVAKVRKHADEHPNFVPYRDFLEKCGGVHEALVLEHKRNRHQRLLVVHGHQGDLNNDLHKTISEWFVWKVWRPLQLMGIADPTRASRNELLREDLEKRIQAWIKTTGTPVIIGHTHTSQLDLTGNPGYINSGSCVNLGGITGIEIAPYDPSELDNAADLLEQERILPADYQGLLIRQVEWRVTLDRNELPTTADNLPVARYPLRVQRTVIRRRALDQSFFDEIKAQLVASHPS